MSDLQTPVAGATLKLSPETIQAIKEAWRSAGGVDYSSPKGQICAMAEPKLLAFLSEFLRSADRTAGDRAGPTADLHRRLDQTEHALFQLIQSICPARRTGDLLEDAAAARATMASAEPAAYFAIDDEPASDGSARYLHIGAEHSGDEDVFPMYLRAPMVAELATHIDQHQVAGEVNASDSVATASAAKPASAAKKAGTK